MSVAVTNTEAGGQLHIQPAERWVVERKFRSNSATSSNSPFTILLLDRQYYIAAGACFLRHVREIHTEEMCTKLSQINIPFTPETQGLAIHWIRIWRDGEAIEQVLNESDVELETQGDSRVVARHRLEDLRIGDSIDVGYSTTSNTRPVDGRFSNIHPLRQQVPILDWHLSTISPGNRKLESHCRINDLSPTVRELSEGSQYYHWQQSGLPPASRIANCPAWHQANPELHLSNYQSWTEVAGEINTLWSIEAVTAKSKDAAREIVATEGAAGWGAAQDLVRFVQQQITTTGSDSLSKNPTSPTADILASATGDARSKACLLVTLLRSIGIPAAPVLVSKKRTRSLRNALPSPDYFDHVIVRGRIDGEDFWIDPCATHEGGSIKNLTLLPPYGFGLQISAKTKNLCPIPATDRDANSLTTTEHFVTREDGGAKLSVTIRAKGTEANSLRAGIADSGVDEAAASRLETLVALYPGTVAVGEPSTEDEHAGNELVLREEFEIPDLFDGDSARLFTPHSIRGHLTTPPLEATTNRSDPWAIEFPCNLRHHIVVDSQWAPGDDEDDESSPGTAFAFSCRSKTKGKRHTLSYAYEALDDHIVAVDFASVRMRLEKIRRVLTYSITAPNATSKQPEKSAADNSSPGADAQARERERKSGPKTAPGFLKPLLAGVAAILLVLVVKGAIKGGIKETSDEIVATKITQETAERESRRAEEIARQEREAEAAAQEPAKEKTFALPENPLDYRPPPAVIPGPDFKAVGFGTEGENTSRGGDPRTESSDLRLGK